MEITQEMKDWIDVNLDFTIERDYRDEPINEKTIVDILQKIQKLADKEDLSSDQIEDMIRSEVADIVFNAYEGYDFELHKDAANAVAKEFNIQDGEDKQEILDYLFVHHPSDFPNDSFLNDSYNVVVMIDVGDADSEYTVNQIEPAFDGYPVEEISDKSGVLWLAQQNGYTKEEFVRLMIDEYEDTRQESVNPFIRSMYEELLNVSSHCNSVVFLGQMTLEEMAIAQKEGVTIPKDAVCGLFDALNGAGGILSIELQKDIYVPADKTRFILPDHGDHIHHSVQSVYGMPDEDWGAELHAGKSEALEEKKIKGNAVSR